MVFWHRDREVDKAFIGLMDALVTWERETGRTSRLFFFPDADDEDVIFLQDGKPVNWDPLLLISQLEMAMKQLKGRWEVTT